MDFGCFFDEKFKIFRFFVPPRCDDDRPVIMHRPDYHLVCVGMPVPDTVAKVSRGCDRPFGCDVHVSGFRG